jgi:hypothetical protein
MLNLVQLLQTSTKEQSCRVLEKCKNRRSKRSE